MVLEYFRAHAHEHFSVEQIYKLLNGEERVMSMATVYRVLAQLVDTRLLSSVAFGDGRTVYELNDGKPHDHLVCTACGDIDEFFDTAIEARQKEIVDSRDFTLSGRQLVLFGICSACRKAGVRLKSPPRR